MVAIRAASQAAATRKLLLISHVFPPLVAGGAPRMGQFARLLPEFGWDVTVLTAKHGANGIDREAVSVAGGSTSGVGSGGMASKVGSARIVTRTGVPAVVAPGREPDVLLRVLAGADVGTLFVPAGTTVLSSRKHWIAYGSKPIGRLTVDDGAARALKDAGKSLLPAGIIQVDGDFELGDIGLRRPDIGASPFAIMRSPGDADAAR